MEHNQSLFSESCNGHFAKFQPISEGGDFAVDREPVWPSGGKALGW